MPKERAAVFEDPAHLIETSPQQDAAERAINKFARTYAAQIEVL
jgi:hypothetical protein